MNYIFDAIVIAYLIIAMIMDLKWRRVKNEWIVTGYFISLLIHLIFNSSVTSSLYGLILPLPLLIFYKFKMIGAGDIKLLSVCGCILGFDYMINCLLPIMAFSILLSAISIIIGIIQYLKTQEYKLQKIPLAVAIALGIIVKIVGGYYQ